MQARIGYWEAKGRSAAKRCGGSCWVALWLLWLPAAAMANSTGITGYSGKQGPICTQCHSGGVAPLVQFQGPTQLAPGAIGTYHFIVTSQAAMQDHAGFNVAASGGTLAIVSGQGEQLSGAELTHSAPKANSGGAASWDFTWQAPLSPGAYTLYGAGNSVKINFLPSGDNATATTYSVDVAAPTATPTSGPSATPTETPTISPTRTATNTPSETPTRTASPTITETPTRTPTPTATSTPFFAFCDPTPVPLNACRLPTEAQKAQLLILDGAPDTLDRIVWRYRSGPPSFPSGFGDPNIGGTTTAFCVYDAGGLLLEAIIPPGGLCGGRPCWRQTATGFSYRDPTAAHHGVASMRLRQPLVGAASITVRAKGAAIGLPASLMLAQPLIVQVKNSQGICWADQYSAPALRNDATQFRDKGD